MTCTTGCSVRPARLDDGPSGWRQSAPTTRRHHGASGIARVRGASAGSSPAKTSDHPKRSASVTCPVAPAKAPNWALVTAVAPIQKASRRTWRTGPSPLPRKPARSCVPIQNQAPGSRTIPAIPGHHSSTAPL